MKQPDDFQLYSAVMAHGAFNWGLEEPEIEVGFNVDSFQVKDDKFEGKTSQYTLDSSSLSDFIDPIVPDTRFMGRSSKLICEPMILFTLFCFASLSALRK